MSATPALDGDEERLQHRSHLVTRRTSITEMRQSGRLSGGGSSKLMRHNSITYAQRAVFCSNSDILQPTYIFSLMEDIQWALTELHCAVDPIKLEAWAIFVHAALTQDFRAYHGVGHVFEISAGCSPIQLLAAIFRDTLNHQLDQQPCEKHKELISNVLIQTESNCVLQPNLRRETDERSLLVAAIFGYKPGDDLSVYQGQGKGLDIFLSTVAATRLLKDSLTKKHTAQLAVCLEATIPFRQLAPAAAQEPTPLDRLFGRLQAVNIDFTLGMTDAEMVETVQWGADLNNRNVGKYVHVVPFNIMPSLSCVCVMIQSITHTV